MSKDNKSAAHGQTRGDMKELHRKLQNGEDLPMIAANGPDAPAGFEIRADEAHLVHVQLETPLFSQSTGAKLSTPQDQKYSVREFEETKQNGGFAGYTTKVLHYPGDKKAEAGSSIEGARRVDSNFAVMQDAYESITGEKAPDDWTEHQLDGALKMARTLHGKLHPAGTGGAPAPIQDSEIAPNKPALVVGEPVADAAIAEANANKLNGESQADAKQDIADAAKNVGDNVAPTADGNTSVGQATVSVDALKKETEQGGAAANMNAMEQAAANSAQTNANRVAPSPTDTPAPGGRRGAARPA